MSRNGCNNVTNTHQWSAANSLAYLYVMWRTHYRSEDAYSFLMFCGRTAQVTPTSSSVSSSVWTRLAHIPISYGASLVKSRDHVLAIARKQ